MILFQKKKGADFLTERQKKAFSHPADAESEKAYIIGLFLILRCFH
jgi:hypothetical protein